MISVLIPWRSQDLHRILAWDYNRARWEASGVQLCVADDDRTEGPFSLARAVNKARRQATGEYLAIFGADHIPPTPDKLAWIADRLRQHPWTAVYALTRIFAPDRTARILRGQLPTPVMKSHVIHACEGIVALRAEVWDDVGGMDERFEGWGAEDTAFKAVLFALYPDGRGDGVGEAWALWHPDRHGTPEMTAANIARCTDYQTAAREGRMREYIEGVRRGGPGHYL